ncbi:hypothetical protein [Priestia aryabhattai]
MGTLRDEIKRWNKLNCVLKDNKKRSATKEKEERNIFRKRTAGFNGDKP